MKINIVMKNKTVKFIRYLRYSQTNVGFKPSIHTDKYENIFQVHRTFEYMIVYFLYGLKKLL